MSYAGLALLGFGTLAFLIWAFFMFRTLFAIRRRASEATGSTNPGPGSTLAAWGAWFRDPAERRARRQLAVSTLAVIASVAAFTLLIPVIG